MSMEWGLSVIGDCQCSYIGHGNLAVSISKCWLQKTGQISIDSPNQVACLDWTVKCILKMNDNECKQVLTLLKGSQLDAFSP